METLIQRLNVIPNSYFEFVDSVIDYAELKESHFNIIMEYLENNPTATPSDVIKFISFQPDFFEDSAPIDIDTLVG